MAKLHISLNSSEHLESLLQESYDLANGQIKQAQDEISKLSNATVLKDLTMDEKAKYSTAIKDFLTLKDKAIGRKLDICKVMQEVLKFNGDLTKAINSENIKQATSIDFSKIREELNKENGGADKKEIYKM